MTFYLENMYIKHFDILRGKYVHEKFAELFVHKGKIWKAPNKCPKNMYNMAFDTAFIWSYFRQ